MNNVRYTIAHVIDELTDYHVAELAFDPNSGWMAKILRDRWYQVFGTPDVLVTDEGNEFKGAVVRLHELCGVQHDVVPDQAKWRMGHCERHGAILKVIMMKVVSGMRIDRLEDMRWVLAYDSGVSPLQAVTGRNSSMPGSLLDQITSGKIKFKFNDEMDKDDALRRSERIRAAAIEACHWLDAHHGLRRALNAKSKPPDLIAIKEGTSVYVYDPPVERKGLARRLQDNVSWTGPGVIVCVERQEDSGVPKKIWVRVRTKLKAYPLERIRLATADEMVSSSFITNALMDVQKELEDGRLKIFELAQKEKKKGRPKKIKAEEPPAVEDKKREKRSAEGEPEEEDAKKKRLQYLEDVPLQIKDKKDVGEPSELPFAKKQRLFENLAKELGAPSEMAEAQLRGHLEDNLSKVLKLKKAIKKDAKRKQRDRARGSDDPPQREQGVCLATVEVDEELAQTLPDFVEVYWQELDAMGEMWCQEDEGAEWSILRKAEGQGEQDRKDALQAELVTGKLRVEAQWKNLDAEWRAAYKEPIKKAVKIYFDYGAMEGVKEDAFIDPRKILPSRFVLTNKGGETLLEAILKARWILGGHKDMELGQYATMAPTSSLLGHNLLNFLAVQHGWTVYYEDVSSAFLQGKPLPEGREVYVKLPQGYPDCVNEFIREMVGEGYRLDILKLLKGGFGLAESPRLWYLECKNTLEEIGLHELKLVPGMFRAFHEDGRLRAVVCIHVDDTRYAGDDSAQQLWDQLHDRLKFGSLRAATEGWQKFCGRWEKQDPETKEFTYAMDKYMKKVPDIPKKLYQDVDKELTEYDRKFMGSILGQLNWAARQGRYDLSFGVSHCQQLIAGGKKSALEWTQKLIVKARWPLDMKVVHLGCPLEEMLVLSASDAAFAGQPKAASQGGVTCLLANPSVLKGEAQVVIMEAMSMKIQRVVRCSMSAELSMAATAFEHGDFLRAIMAELVFSKFKIGQWKWWASKWKHYLIVDAKTGYDVLKSEVVTADRKIMIDAAVLREAMGNEECGNYVRWMPGHCMVSDGLTKWQGNGILEMVMQYAKWSLVDTPEAQALRVAAAARKRAAKAAQQAAAP